MNYFNFSTLDTNKRYYIVKGGRGSGRRNTYLYAGVMLCIIGEEIQRGFRQPSEYDERDLNAIMVLLITHRERIRNRK